ncbi:MAG: response regulator transcription factor [Firmicutes bacterium]|nr:response regulator transcription factor [Bacillota bacterium]MCL5039713.1 response regulator transcription factor [Bacillota bacterium]
MKILIVDDHEVVRIGLTAILENQPGWQVVGEAATGEEAITSAAQLQPDLILMDVRLPGLSGIEACRQILSQNPAIKVIMLTSYPDEEAVQASIMAGAAGYVLKDIGSEALLEGIRRVERGEALLDPGITRSVLTQLRTLLKGGQKREPSPSITQLTDREEEILFLIGDGLTNRDIAQRLFLSEKTVRNHVSNILDKLDLRNRTQVAAYVSRRDNLLRDR